MHKILPRIFLLPAIICIAFVGAFGQSKKKAPIDLFGPIVGFSMLIDNGDRDGDGTLRTLTNLKTPFTPTIGASYHRFVKRWSHIFQSRYSSSKLSYDEVRSLHVKVNGERILYQTEIGPTTIKFNSLNMVYLLGYCINKPAGIHIYLGEQMGMYASDKSNREVEIVTLGKYEFINNSTLYTPFPEPVLSHKKLPEWFSYEFTAEILGRLEARIKLSDKLFLLPSIEGAYDLHHQFFPYRFRIAGFIDMGYTL